MDLTLIERRNLRQSVNRLFTCGNQSHYEFGAKFTVINSVTANAVYCDRREV